MAKRIMILNGAARKNGSTANLIRAFSDGAQSAGHAVQEFYLDSMNIHSCKGCLRAGRDSKSPCSQKDDMEPIYAEIVKMIYERFLAGDSMKGIADWLDSMGVPTPGGQNKWHQSTVRSILQNEKYAGNAVLNKTYVVDCISKKVKRNDGPAHVLCREQSSCYYRPCHLWPGAGGIGAAHWQTQGKAGGYQD